ncbi:MAG: aldo/keto reductase [Deltaproteobacteria bacterium]|nr:MAG: aldo/keto reductase [Deltaproteobacteria bacterium]
MKCTRREFLGTSTKVAASALLGSAILGKGSVEAQVDSTKKSDGVTPEVVPMRTLGRTNLKISMMSVGTSRTNENTIRYAIKRGINFIHTSPTYIMGWSIRKVAKAIKGQRDKVILGLKVTWDWDRDDKLVKSLDSLGTDYVDIVFFPIHNDPEQVASPEVKSTFDRWKKQGRVRFLGLTTHGGMKECMQAALKTGWYDCLMPAYQIHQREQYLDLFKECEEKRIGIVAMKTKISPAKPELTSLFFQDRSVKAICRTISSLKALTGYIEAFKRNVPSKDASRIIQRESLASVGRCTMCGTCTLNCPSGLAVNDMVRCVDYYVDTMDDFEVGKENYLAIDRRAGADHCEQCGMCENACPNNVAIRHYVRRSKEMFS